MTKELSYVDVRERLCEIFDGQRATFADRIYIIKFIDDMHAENMSLHNELGRHKAQLDVVVDKTVELYTENRKLRELVAGMQVCEDDDADAHDCPLYDESEPTRCAYGRFADELGLV